MLAATADGAPLVHDEVSNNIPFDWGLGDADATAAALAGAAHVTRLEIINQRLVTNAIEPRCAIGDYDGARDHYTLYTSSQNPHVIRLLLTAFVLGLPEHKVGGLARRRRRLRQQDLPLRRGGAGDLVLAPARAAGQVDRRAQREFSQ